MTARISTANKNRLNHMNRSAQNVNLGTMVANLGFVSTGSLSVTDAQTNASRVVITTDLTSVGGFIVQRYRSGSPLELNAVSGSVAGTIVCVRPTNITGSVIALGDNINYVAFM